MKSQKKLWYEMLTTYCHLMHYSNGITLPNMIGAYYCYDDSIDLSSSKCVVRVLEDVIANQIGADVLIQKCGNIHHYVLSLFKGKHPKHPNLNDKIYLGMFDIELLQHSSNINDLAEYLYNQHREEILARKFSVTNNEWHSLSDVEMKHINDIIKLLQ